MERCKGFCDLPPEAMRRFRFIEGVFRGTALGWGFQEIKTPALEYLHLFTAAGTLTPGMLGRVYSFLDWDGWSGERVVLRPDGTIPVARFYIENLAGKGLAKLFYVTSIFRFEATGKEARERWQGGAELIGVSSPLADTELVMMSREVLRRLGITEIDLRLSHAGIIRGLLSRLELSPEEQGRVFDRILDGDGEALAGIMTEKPGLARAIRSLVGLKGGSSGVLKNTRALLAGSFPELAAPLDDLMSIAESLEAVGCPYQIDIASGRGFEYYTGVIFELYAGGVKVGGGGRYDALIPMMGGGDVPASGFALYFDELMKLAELEGAGKAVLRGVLVKATRDMLGHGFETASRLREAGYAAEMDFLGKRPGDFRWLVECRGKDSLLLTDAINGRNFDCGGLDGVLKILGRQDDQGCIA